MFVQVKCIKTILIPQNTMNRFVSFRTYVSSEVSTLLSPTVNPLDVTSNVSTSGGRLTLISFLGLFELSTSLSHFPVFARVVLLPKPSRPESPPTPPVRPGYLHDLGGEHGHVLRLLPRRRGLVLGVRLV